MNIILIILAVIIFLVAFLLWSTVTFEIAANAKKVVITASMYGFIKKDFILPSEPRAEKNPENNMSKNFEKKTPKKSVPKNEGSENPAVTSEKEDISAAKRIFGSMWDSDVHWFDFANIYDAIEKYTTLISRGGSALAVFLRKMKRKIRTKRLDLYLKFGLGSPDKTGVAYGAAHAVAGSLNAFIRSYFKSDTGLVLYLDPDYVNSCFEFELGSIIKTRAAHVLHALLAALIRFIINYLKGSVGSVRNFRQASD